MSRAQDDFCPACRLGLCVHCFLASREWDNPTACLCDCEWATMAREELRKEQGLPERTYYPATAQESKTDLNALFKALQSGDAASVWTIINGKSV